MMTRETFNQVDNSWLVKREEGSSHSTKAALIKNLLGQKWQINIYLRHKTYILNQILKLMVTKLKLRSCLVREVRRKRDSQVQKEYKRQRLAH